MKCKKCGENIVYDERNRNLEMVTRTLCFHCKHYESLKAGEWYQDSKGEYKQKKEVTI